MTAGRLAAGTGRSRVGRLLAAAGAVAALGSGALAYAVLVEPRWFALRRLRLPILPEGEPALRILHLSDLHLVPGDDRKIAWVRALARLRPDVVINTGDTISHPHAVATSIRALEPFHGMPSAFVYGNNDFWQPVPKSPHHYFLRSRPEGSKTQLPWREYGAVMREHGWLDLNNRRGTLTVRGRRIALAGVDDAHTLRDRYDAVSGPADSGAVVRIGVTHSPEPRVLDGLAADGYDLTLAGHTHGGQVRLPGIGALVTNSGLDRSRSRGLSRWGSRMLLNVSAGLGMSPYAPVRFLCRPEATLLTLEARS